MRLLAFFLTFLVLFPVCLMMPCCCEAQVKILKPGGSEAQGRAMLADNRNRVLQASTLPWNSRDHCPQAVVQMGVMARVPAMTCH